MNKNLGSKIKELRNKKEWSLREVEKRTGINYSVLSRIESGKRPVTDEEIIIFSKLFNVTTDFLLGREKNNPPIEVFRKRLKECREEKELTYGDLAEVASVTPTYIEKLETEATELPGLRTFYAIADKLGVTPDYLGGFTNDKQGRSPDTPKPKELTDLLNKDIMFHGVPLDDEERQKILAVMEAMFWDAKAKNKRKK